MINFLKNTLNKINNEVYIGFIGLVLLMCLTISSVMSPSTTSHPSTTSEFFDTSVMIVDSRGRSGGSGVILNSSLSESEVLTNKHVCSLAVRGGYVIKNNKKYLVAAIKKYPIHDLCLVKVRADLGIKTNILRSPVKRHSKAYISGHPALLPHVLTTGHFSGRVVIKLVVGIRECSLDNTSRECSRFGTFRIVQPFESQVVSGTILPGSSGSAVFNEDGLISGLVFAGNGRGLGYAYIVPQEYLIDFIDNRNKYKYVNVTRTNYSRLSRSIFNTKEKCIEGSDLCKDTTDDYIWRSQ